MTEYTEEEYLLLSGLQHFSFCRRQWALIHIEQQWQENFLTIDGEIKHEHAHDDHFAAKRGDLVTVRGMAVASRTLGLSGQCDVVEFRAEEQGISLARYGGTYVPYPVEYKRGKPKQDDCDRLQLCAQALCLEEMLACEISEGALYYLETRRREPVQFDDALRQAVCSMAKEMHAYYQRRHTPKVKTGTFCRQCSLQEICLPVLCKRSSAGEYIRKRLEEAP
ncbi:MAG: CRISPR-associated protein Cas4 [Oscillospiraceae bacterium]|jgi:CRISPR-associated exonuclease Cas4|nr:CRISPR-associated protein Cas4 [Oscillospiraceae bacterium]